MSNAIENHDGTHDFDFFYGRWRVQNRRLTQRLQGCTDWENFEGTQECVPLPGGLGNTDQMQTSDGKTVGWSVRFYNPIIQQWGIYWVGGRDYLLLPPEQLHQKFDIGHENLLETAEHLVGNIEVWTDLMLQHPIPQYPADVQAERETLDSLIARHEAAADAFGKLAHQLADENRLDDAYSDFLDNPPKLKSFGGTIAHVLTHNHAHRTEIMHMLTRLGVANVIEGDVLGWEAMA